LIYSPYSKKCEFDLFMRFLFRKAEAFGHIRLYPKVRLVYPMYLQ